MRTEAVQLEMLLAHTPFELVRPLGPALPLSRPCCSQERQRERQAVMKLIPAGPTLVEALQVEAACLDRLRHPRIPRVLDGYAPLRGCSASIQEYIPGPSLQGSLDLLRRKQRLAELLRQVLHVLEQVHAAGLVHGDLHPANLIPPQEEGPLFLVDFSLLKARLDTGSDQRSAGFTGVSEDGGRPFFSAPERARFGRYTSRRPLRLGGVGLEPLHRSRSRQPLRRSPGPVGHYRG